MAGIHGRLRLTRQPERLQTRFIDSVIQNNPKARANHKALAQLDGYKRALVSSLSRNPQQQNSVGDSRGKIEKENVASLRIDFGRLRRRRMCDHARNGTSPLSALPAY